MRNYGPQSTWAEDICIDGHDRVGSNAGAAQFRSKVGGTLRIDIGQCQLCPLLRKITRQTAANTANALNSDVHARHAIGAKGMLCRRLNAQIYTARRIGTGISALLRQSGNMRRDLRQGHHVCFRHADILRCDIFPAERIHRAGKGVEHILLFGARSVGKNDCFAAAGGKPRHRVFVAHTTRQAQRICNRSLVIAIMPKTGSARGWPQMGRMHRDNGP